MKSEDILALFDSFEKAATQINGIECWSARSLCQLLGYTDWRNFLNAIEKAKESCINAGEQESDHFVGVNKMVPLGSGSQRSIEDISIGYHVKSQRGVQFRQWATNMGWMI